MANETFIHDSAQVSEHAQIGAGTKIWNNAQVREKSKIGENCIISKDVYIDSNVEIGNGCKVQNSVSVYDGVTLEDDVFVGPNVSFTNDKIPRAFNTEWEITGTHVKKGASLGANCTILCGITIGEYALVAAGSVVTKDVKPYSLVMGNPAQHIGQIDKMGNPAKHLESIRKELLGHNPTKRANADEKDSPYITERRVKVSLLGVGQIGRNHLRVLSSLKGIELSYIFDTDQKALEKYSERFDVKATNDINVALKDIDAVIIATPTNTHLDYFKYCVDKVPFVFIEKPIAETSEQALEIKKLADEFGTHVQIGFIERFNPTIIELKNITAQDAVLNADFTRTNRLSNRMLEFDVINNLLSHDIDLALYINGPIKGLTAYGQKNDKHVTLASVTLNHKNGSFSRVLASRVTEKKMRHVEVTTENAFINCELAKKELLIHRLTQTNYNDEEQPFHISSQAQQVVLNPQEALLTQLELFVKMCNGFEVKVPNIADGLETLLIGEQVRKHINEQK